LKVAVSVMGNDLESRIDHRFGRCSQFLIVDTDNLRYERVANCGNESGSGAGISAAQLVINRGCTAVITGQIGPNATRVLDAAGIAKYAGAGYMVKKALQLLQDQKLPRITQSGPAHAGVGAGLGHQHGHGR